MKNQKYKSKIKNFLFRFWPIIFIVAVWFVFSSPYFLQGRVPYASTYQVNFFHPWSHYEKFGGPVKNNAMPDVHTQIYPWKKFTIDTYKEGQIPLWNPYSFAGNPHLANYQSAVFSPFNLLFFVLPFIDAWSILILLQPLLAGIFTYVFVRAIGVSRAGCLVSSIAFMFCGFIVVWMAYGTLVFAILYLPLALFAIERYGQTQRKGFLALLTLTIPLSFFSGHFQISFYFLAVTLLYVVFKIVTARKQALLISLPATIFVGLLLSLPQLLPSIELYRQAVRSELFKVGEAVPFQYLVTSFAPDFFGNPVTRNDWFGHYAEWASFIGVLPLILGIYAIVRRKGIFFAVLALVALVLAVDSPVSNFIVSLKIPVISTSALSRVIVIFSFAAAVLAGFGIDKLLKDIREGRGVRESRGIGLLTGVFFAAIWVLLFLSNIYPEEWLIVAKRNLVLPTALFLVGALIVGAHLFSRPTSGESLRNTPEVFGWTPRGWTLLITCYFLFATSFDSFRFAQKWMPFDPKNLVYVDVPVIKAIEEHIGDGRMFGNVSAEATVPSYFGFPSIEGYDPLYIARYGEFIRSAAIGEYIKGERSRVTIDRQSENTDRVLDLLGVTLFFHPIVDTNQGWAYPVWREDRRGRYTLVYQDGKHQLYKNNFALPRVSLFYDFEKIGSDQEMIKRFYTKDFDFRKKLILEEEPGIVRSKDATGSAEIISYKPNKVTIKVQTTHPGLLFLADNFYPGWKASVNGKEEKIYRADYTFRAVKVPQGESTAEFMYKPTLSL